MDKAASKQLRIGTFKLPTPLIGIFLYMSAILPVLGPKIAQAKLFKGPKHKQSDFGPKTPAKQFRGPKHERSAAI